MCAMPNPNRVNLCGEGTGSVLYADWLPNQDSQEYARHRFRLVRQTAKQSVLAAIPVEGRLQHRHQRAGVKR